MTGTAAVRWAALGLTLAAACRAAPARKPGAPEPLAMQIEPRSEEMRLTLVAAPGYEINARLKPALELPEGKLLRFDTARLTPDSAYFAEPPAATLPGHRRVVRGTLRASVCAPGEQVCRSVALAVVAEVP
ncbi:MAG TPA: hypothetical protein VFW66_13815 [Gemmatimonadales bacterium]|nr:hypothetical protein [Gemmatimonadales bacterium]